MESEHAVDQLGSDPTGSFAYPCGGGSDDALLGGQQLGRRVAPVAAGGRHDVAALGSGCARVPASGSARTRTTPSRYEESGRERGSLVGGDVEGPGQRTHGVSPGEGRSEQGDGQCPGGGDPCIRKVLLVDLPVVERHAVLAGEDPEDLLRPLRGRARGIVSAPRPAVRSSTVALAGAHPLRQGARCRRVARANAHAGRQPTSPLRACELAWRGRHWLPPRQRYSPAPPSRPRCRSALGERPEHRPWDISQLAQTVAPDVPGQPERGELGAQGGAVEGARRHLPGEEVPPVGGGPATVGALDQVGDDDMGVELGVAGPAGAVPKRRADEPLGFDQLGPGMATAGVAGLLGEVVEHGADGPVVGDRDRVTDLLGSEGPEQGDALGGGERQVVAGPAAWLDLEAQRFPLRPRFRPAGSAEPRLRPGRPARAVRPSPRSTVRAPRLGRGSSRRRCWPPCRGSSQHRRRRRAALSRAWRRRLAGAIGLGPCSNRPHGRHPRTSPGPQQDSPPGENLYPAVRGIPPGGRRAPFGAQVWNVAYRSGGADGRA